MAALQSLKTAPAMTVGLVVTTIQGPNAVMQSLAAEAGKAGARFFVLGDRKSPPTYDLPGCDYFDLAAQHKHFGAFSELLPVGHYVRKNLGYLAALSAGCQWIVETDDDNYPLDSFFKIPPESMRVRRIKSERDWVNVYRYFAPSSPVWPRGFPLEALGADRNEGEESSWAAETPVLVQGLADDNPDVDAVFRLTRELPLRFDDKAPPISLERGNWCPYNSQNTWMRRDIAVLAYLPAFCSFRMTDIWRSFVAQRCLWEMGHRLIFTAPSVRQERNEHNLLRDFKDEIPGYLQNAKIAQLLGDAKLKGEPGEDLLTCYEALVKGEIMPADELKLVKAWLMEVGKRM